MVFVARQSTTIARPIFRVAANMLAIFFYIGVDRRAKRTPLAGCSASKRDPSFRWFNQPAGFSVGEVGLLVLETVVRIRREYAGGKAIKAIGRDLHISRKVIRDGKSTRM